MENITLRSMIKEFANKNSLSDTDSLLFERFSIYSLLVNEFYDSFDAEKLGTGQCIGVDAVAVSIGDVLVYSAEEASGLTRGQFDARFQFVQCKTASKLDLGDYLKFLQTIKIFFSGTRDQQPVELLSAFDIKTHIYDKASKFKSRPRLDIYYIYAGQGLIEDENFKTQVNASIREIEALPYLFSKTKNYLKGGDALADLYKESQNRIAQKMFFQRHVALPKLRNSTAAYLGVAKCVDYVDILKNQDGQINKGVFYDNVRDFLGETNPVNVDIAETIKSEAQRNLFSVLNNGVTIVAKKVVPSGDLFEISGFQVVNGCQTSHVLFNNRDHITDDMYITVKLIETDDIDLTGSVIKATNSQSIVMKEAFATIKPYHKRLEDFFGAMHGHGYKLYYERRPHQFDDNDDITQTQIVSAPQLIKSFISVVKEEPHQVHYYYGQILREYNTEKSTLLFSDESNPAFYFISHVIVSRTKEFAVRNRMRAWTYHIALLIKKRLGFSLSVGEKLTDSRALEILEVVRSGFNEAADFVVKFLMAQKLGENDNMNPAKTKELVKNFFIYTKSAPIEVKRASSNEQAMGDGTYIVKDAQVLGNIIRFMYGPFQYENRIEKGASSELQHKRAQITIKDDIVFTLKAC